MGRCAHLVALDQTRMARIVFHHDERGCVVFEHGGLLSPINERSGAPSMDQRAPHSLYAIDVRRMRNSTRTQGQQAVVRARQVRVVTRCHQ